MHRREAGPSTAKGNPDPGATDLKQKYQQDFREHKEGLEIMEKRMML